MVLDDRATDAIVDAGFALGMAQHDNEIRPFAHWLAQRRPNGLGHVLEIGTLHGGTMRIWGALAASGSKLLSVDLPDGVFGGAAHGYNLDRCQARNAGLKAQFPTFEGFLGNSQEPEAGRWLDTVLGPDKLDLLFIDGDHRYNGVLFDYLAYHGLVAPGGFVVFHDIADTPHHREVLCEVPQLWDELIVQGSHADYQTFIGEGNPWGGIGVITI